MPAILSLLVMLSIGAFTASRVPGDAEKDVIHTQGGDLEITFLGHGTLMLRYQGKTIHIDPWSRVADYGTLPKADLILVTHHHGDHLDVSAIDAVRTKQTIVLVTQECSTKVAEGVVMRNGESRDVVGITVSAVPAYNLVHVRDSGEPFHPKGQGNGYVIDFAGTKVYVAGDTENTPEMKALKMIDVAFLPMNLPYTMTPEMVADAVKAFRPRILYPYHYGETEVSKLLDLLKDVEGVEVRVRNMK